jgi:hypothetical protein
MKIRAFITHKLKENYADCQDRFGVNPDAKSIAVSDGMSQSWQQKIWAQILVDKYINSDWHPSKENIEPLCIQWRKDVISSINKSKEINAPESIIYRNERNLSNGSSAGATFVGVRFQCKEWEGTVLGDSCLIEWDGQSATFHTSQEVECFDNQPDYFDSDFSKKGKGIPKNISGELKKGTVLFIVSDPFSDFLFEHNKQNDIAKYLEELRNISSHEKFEELVDAWRNSGMHNDDTTLVIVENDGKDDFSIDHEDKIVDLIRDEKKEEEESNSKDRNCTIGGILDESKDNTASGLISEIIAIFKKVKKVKLKNKHFLNDALHELLEKYEIAKK